MKFLINASNLRVGGGLQVTDSICSELCKFTQHQFVCVLSSTLNKTIDRINDFKNIKVFEYDIKNSFNSIFWGRDQFLDQLVEKENIDAVLTIFGPSRWNPRCPHLCGFARAQLLLTDSPYYKKLTIKEKILYKIWTISFKRSSKCFYTENPYISSMLPTLLGKDIKVYSVTNYYNQVFDHPNNWKIHKLPTFDGTTLLTISTFYPHKNLTIAIDIAKILKKTHSDFHFRFVYSFDEKEFPFIEESLKEHFLFIGRVDVAECPSLYKQANIAFQPTLMECFTATYPEAMRMKVPIVTTDLEFARGLCGDAAYYYYAVNPKAAAEAIYKVATDTELAQRLVEEGKNQLLKFDNYEQRAEKLIKILESLAER